MLVDRELAAAIMLEQLRERRPPVRVAGPLLGAVERTQDVALAERSSRARPEHVGARPGRRRRPRLVFQQHQRRRARQRKRRLALVCLQPAPPPLPVHLMREPDRRGVDVAQLEVLPPETQQLALARTDYAGEPKQRRPRLRGRQERLCQPIALIDPPLRRATHLRTLTGLQQLERTFAAPPAVPPRELEHTPGSLEYARDGPLAEPLRAELAHQPSRIRHVDRVHPTTAPARRQVIADSV